MNVAFLNPPFIDRYSRSSRSPAVTKGGTLYYPLWLAYAAGATEQAGFAVTLIDAPADGLDLQRVIARLEAFRPGILVVDTSTGSIHSDIAVADAIKKRFPGLFVVLVGTHPSALPEETLARCEGANAVAVGEYDGTISDLAQAIAGEKSLDSIHGLVFQDARGMVRNPPREKICELDALPFVSAVYAKHLTIRNYFFAAAGYPMVMIITGRGCPFNCFYCVYPQVFHGRRYRTRSPENVAAEFEAISRAMPEVREVGIEDDCFTADKERVSRICELLVAHKNRLPWYCNVRGDVPLDLLILMKKAGCRLVTVGFESGSQKVLDGIPKHTTVDQYLEFGKNAKKAGILVHGCIMVGNPGDTPETLAESYRFACALNCDSMQFYPLFVYPGTEAFAWAKERGYLRTTDFSAWNNAEGAHNATIDLPGLGAEEMARLCDYYLRKYHLRPRYILMKLLQALINPSEGYRTFKSARVFFAGLIRNAFSGKLS